MNNKKTDSQQKENTATRASQKSTTQDTTRKNINANKQSDLSRSDKSSITSDEEEE